MPLYKIILVLLMYWNEKNIVKNVYWTGKLHYFIDKKMKIEINLEIGKILTIIGNIIGKSVVAIGRCQNKIGKTGKVSGHVYLIYNGEIELVISVNL